MIIFILTFPINLRKEPPFLFRKYYIDFASHLASHVKKFFIILLECLDSCFEVWGVLLKDAKS
jgi:hypothetical protein